ncbi:DNA-directed RNA polymerase subunit D [Candidatus Pacearchaeota archaeon]|nr:MAG: DNA-directed RNA polymerase subunit D [Candidatus Pacearchaeota archaeon]
MAMKCVEKSNDKIKITCDIDVSLANAIRRSVNEVPTLAISEVDFYANDSILYDEIIAHRLGLVPLKNQKVKRDIVLEYKIKASAKKGERKMVLAGELGEDVVYPEMPIVLLEDGQKLELVAKAVVGIGKDHARFSPGMIYYRHVPKIKISSEGEKQSELAELYPEIFEFDGKLKVKDALKCELDDEDFKDFPGISVEFDGTLLMVIESWGQMGADKVLLESCKALKENLSKIVKELKL